MRWTTIGLSAGTQKPGEAPEKAEDAAQKRDWKKRIATVWIPAILAVGLLTSFSYLGVRIAAAKSQAKTVVPVARTAVPPTPAVVHEAVKPEPELPTPKPQPKAIAEQTNFMIIVPQSGEKYIQLAAITPHMVLSYVDDLRKLDLQPIVVAPGPTPELLRILVGPFADRESLEKAKATLETAKRAYLVRVY
jgi:cell division septation protein DedD